MTPKKEIAYKQQNVVEKSLTSVSQCLHGLYIHLSNKYEKLLLDYFVPRCK